MTAWILRRTVTEKLLLWALISRLILKEPVFYPFGLLSGTSLRAICQRLFAFRPAAAPKAAADARQFGLRSGRKAAPACVS